MRTIGYDFAEQFHRCRRGRHLFQRDFIRKVHQAGARPADRRAVLPALRLSSRPTIWVVHSKMPMVLTMSHIMATSPLTPSIRPRFSAFDGLLTDGQSVQEYLEPEIWERFQLLEMRLDQIKGHNAFACEIVQSDG